MISTKPAAFAAAFARGSIDIPALRRGSMNASKTHEIGAPKVRSLLSRTTTSGHESRAPTKAGERLLRTVAPRLAEIDAELAGLSDLREKPAGAIRITAGEHAAETVLWPALARLLPDYPDVKVEIVIDNGLTDIVTERFDAGVRLGGQVAKDIVALRIGPEIRMAVVGSRSYFARRSRPKQPQDLTAHDCINLRLPTYDSLYVWEFEKAGRELKVRVEGRLVFNTLAMRLEAALAGLGLTYLPEDPVRTHLVDGRLIRVLGDGVRHFPTTISITRAGNPCRPSLCLSKRCAIVPETEARVCARFGKISAS
jgi:DNA-binding transcriptional LysR family regulator